MSVAVTMPRLGESVVEGTVARWLKAPGDPIVKLEPLLEITTDKIDTETPAPADGVLLEIIVAEGQTVAAGTVLAYIGQPGEQPAARKPQAAPQTQPPANIEVSGHTPSPQAERLTPAPAKPEGRAFVSPVVARLVAEHGVELDAISGSGLNGRVTKQDVLAYVARQPALATQTPVTEAAHEALQPLTAMRAAIARRMSAATAIPQVTTIFEADMTAVVRHREAHKAAYAQKGIRLTYTAFFVAAAAQALRAVPELNACFVEQGAARGIAFNPRIHIGVAVALDNGLIVPVIRDADEKNLAGLARAVAEAAEQARAGNLTPDDLQDGTFTVTNHGVGGSLIGTPILHAPQAGILGIGAIVKRPVVRSSRATLLPDADDALVIRPMCYLNLTFDHRVLDGARADEFLAGVVARLEQWPQDGESTNETSRKYR